ncbi:MAG: CBS domain-containing protein [Thermoleophilia bacterium]|nr:CBS domain-containing protein [Thermoleophilia bacterium]
MSPRAAARLATIGFEQVYDYTAGKADWAAAGLPLEGTGAAIPRAGDFARRDVPTCTLHDDLRTVRDRVRDSGWDLCIVLDSNGVVIGRLGRAALAADDHRSVEAAMSAGPGTIRPNVPLERIVTRLRERNLHSAVVTTSDGRLVGVLRRDDAESRAGDDASKQT